MGRSIFDSSFKTKYFTLENINWDPVNQAGTCKLDSKGHEYVMIWTIKNYPMEAPMPGAPFSIQVNYTILRKNNRPNTSFRSMSGVFVYQLNSGTLPNNSALGIPYGEYCSIARNNYNCDAVEVEFMLGDDLLEVQIKIL